MPSKKQIKRTTIHTNAFSNISSYQLLQQQPRSLAGQNALLLTCGLVSVSSLSSAGTPAPPNLLMCRPKGHTHHFPQTISPRSRRPRASMARKKGQLSAAPRSRGNLSPEPTALKSPCQAFYGTKRFFLQKFSPQNGILVQFSHFSSAIGLQAMPTSGSAREPPSRQQCRRQDGPVLRRPKGRRIQATKQSLPPLLPEVNRYAISCSPHPGPRLAVRACPLVGYRILPHVL